MLGRGIYEHTKRDIQMHADTYTTELRNEITTQTSLYKAVRVANIVSNRYHAQLVQTIFTRLHEIGVNAVEYYAPGLDPLQKEREVSHAMDELVHNKYYGMTLPQRLKQSHLQLRYNIKRSSSVGVNLPTKITNIVRVFNDKYPFGAHKHWDTRLFLAEAVRLEHILARNMGSRTGKRLIRWTLSHTHTQTDVCDKLANAVDVAVAAYIGANNLNIDPAGVYFIESVPHIPHPNCQCVLRFIKRRRQPQKPPERRGLIRRIIKAIFG